MLASFRYFAIFCLCLCLFSCVDAVTPKYQFDTGFLLIEGRITDTPGYSEARVSRNEIRFGIYTLTPVEGSTVSCIDEDGVEINWELQGTNNTYQAPSDWVAIPGKAYFLRVVTPQGEVVESEPEVLPTAVPMANVRVAFEQEAYFSTDRSRFIPAFRLLIDFQDPAGETNFYQYRYTAFEDIVVCASCERSRWRNGECIAGPDTRFVRRWDYLCDARCWTFSTGAGINILSDAFSDGQLVTGFEAGRFDYSRQGGLLFDVQQYNISRAAFEYNSVLEGLVDGAGGLNAPLPAALVGNLKDVSAVGTNVLGFIGVAAVSTERIFIERDTFGGTPFPGQMSIIPEPVTPSPPRAPCEGMNRTRERPVGWDG